MSDMIRRMDAIQACAVGPSDEWSRSTRSGYEQAATDCAMNILRIESEPPNPLAALAMRERAAKQVGDHGEWMKSHNLLGNGFDFAGQAKAIRALPTTFSNDELLAAAWQLPEVRALIEAAKAQLQYMDLCNDKGDLERNLRAALAPFTKGDK